MENRVMQIEVEGVSLAVERDGRGPPVVCLHAIGHDARDFDRLVELCGARFEFIRLEWPGQGRSGPDTEPASARRYADLLSGALAALGVERPLVIGNSIGAAAALIHAASHPVRGLVLCDSGGLVEVNSTVRRFCGLFESFFAAGAGGAAWFGPAFALYYHLVLPQKAACAQRRRIVARARQIAPILRQAWASFARPEADLRDLAAGLETPIWVAWSRSDHVIPLALCRPAIERLRQGRLSQFAGGHAAFLEQPEAFAEGFEAFARGLATAPQAQPVLA